MRLIDLSPRVSSATPHWPDDQGFERTTRWSIAAGDSVNVGTATLSAHLGAHIDAPAHVREGASTVECTPLDACVGRCLVVDVVDLVDRTAQPDRAAQPDHTPQPHRAAPAAAVRDRIRALAGETPVERLLLRHRSEAAREWDPQTPGVDPELVRWFGTQGGRLIGIDLDSFDPERSTDLPAHQAAVDGGVVMLEGLDLRTAPEGAAELFAPPLPWVGCDAAPVRAVLRVPA